MESSANPLLRFLLVGGLLLAFQSIALGGTLTVTVLRPNGNSSVPVPGAHVCISGSFGAQSTTTNNSGAATFANAPQGQLTLTASASGFVGQSVQITMGAADKAQSFLLQSGSGGPVCNLAPPTVTLSSLVLNPTSVNGGTASQGTVTLAAAAPATGAVVSLSSNNTSAATVPPSVNVLGGSISATFSVSTSPVSSTKSVVITASSGGTSKTATLTVNAAPPVSQPDQVGTGVTLELDFKINSGAASTKARLVSPTFTAKEISGSTTTDVTASVTHYRILESPNLQVASLSGVPWIPVPVLPSVLALRNGDGKRYGVRRLMFQVKTASLTSNIATDTILLEPVLKEYHVLPQVSALGSFHPLIQYAAGQGFQFPLDFHETCDGNCPLAISDSSIATGTAGIATGGAFHDSPDPSQVCVTKTDYLLFEGRSPNQFWKIQSAAVSGCRVVSHGANRFRAKFTQEARGQTTCVPAVTINVGDVVVEGPEEDDFIDPANPWKNAFVRQP